jgi:ubiquitin C-terminal hydrolase
MEKPNGLINTEGTCYMNATLQCLNNIRELSNYLLQIKEVVPNTIVLNEYINVLKGLRNNTQLYNASKLRERMEKVNKLFRSYKGNDPCDLIIYLFKSLQEDLKNFGECKLWFSEKIGNNTDLKETYDYYIDKTILNDLFSFITVETFFCKCKNPTYNYQTEQMMILNINSNNSIENCINNYKRKYISKLACNNCGECYKITKDIKIYPKFLIIILNSLNKYKKYSVKFDENIFVEEEKKNIKFLLIGIIVHLGYNSDGGHFISYCRNYNKDKSFYKFNDSSVENVNFEEIKKNPPYILFYQRIFGEDKIQNIEDNKEDKEKIYELDNMYRYKVSGNALLFELFYKNQKVNGIIDLSRRKIQKIQINSSIMNKNDLKAIEKIVFPEILKYDDNDIDKKIYNIYILIENYYINKPSCVKI